MVDKKTSQENSGATPSDADIFRGVQGGANVKWSFAQVRSWVLSWLTKATLGLGNVDNTSDATKNSTSATLTNKIIAGASNTLTVRLGSDVTGNLSVGNLNGGLSALASTFWRGDGAWNTAVTSVAAGAGMLFTTITGSGSVAVDVANAANLIAGTSNKILDAAALKSTPAFSVHKNGTDQTGVASATFTQVTFGTELYDVGNYFASNAWTPPAGKVHLNATVAFSGTIVAGANCQIVIIKNGATFLQCGANPFTNAGSATLHVDDIANGSDVYSVSMYITTSSGTATITGNAGQTRFTGHWISP